MPPAGGTNSKTLMRYEVIAKYRVTGRYTDAMIAGVVGLTPQGLAQAVLRPEYQAIEAKALQDHLDNVDGFLEDEAEQIRTITRAAVPLALQGLVEAVSQKKDLRSMLAAAKMIIDLDPNRTLQAAPKLASGSEGGQDGPQLPENVIAHLTTQSNRVVTEIKTNAQGQTTVTTTVPLVLQEEGNA